MRAFPMFIRTTGREVIIVGGGEQAAQKARLIQKTDARIRLLSNALNPELERLVQCGAATLDDGPISPESFEASALVFIATGCPAADVAVHGLASIAGALVNVVDRPDLCDATTPSIVDRDPVVVAIGTEGTAPVLGRKIKSQVEAILPSHIGGLAALAGRFRDRVARHVPQDLRRPFWAWVFKGAPERSHRFGDTGGAQTLMEAAIQSGGPPDARQHGHVTVIAVEPGDYDLLPLRAVERLQEADILFHEADIDHAVLELARRDAERRPFTKPQSASPSDMVAEALSEAKNGCRVTIATRGGMAVYQDIMRDPLTGDPDQCAVEFLPSAKPPAAARQPLALVAG